MKKNDILIEWLDGSSGETEKIGYLNPNGQQCAGHCGVPGTDHGQYAYKTKCKIFQNEILDTQTTRCT